jgi:hypothetical protein
MSEITYTYKLNGVHKVDIPGLTDVIEVVHLMIKGSLGDTQEEIGVMVSLPSPRPSKFIPYTNLSEEDIIQMAMYQMGSEELDMYKNYLSNNIE